MVIFNQKKIHLYIPNYTYIFFKNYFFITILFFKILSSALTTINTYFMQIYELHDLFFYVQLKFCFI